MVLLVFDKRLLGVDIILTWCPQCQHLFTELFFFTHLFFYDDDDLNIPAVNLKLLCSILCTR